jgi:ATP-dependent RNA helicase DDX23/PRP28
VHFDWDPSDDTSSAAPAPLLAAPRARARARAAADEALGAARDGPDERHWTKSALSEMTSRDWRIMREDFDIRISGGRAPNPLRRWDESPLSPEILAALADMGFDKPSPIQRQAIPAGLEWRDIIGIAETGSGKTAAFVIPMLEYIAACPDTMREAAPRDGPLALIMAPTRELALQIGREAQRLAARRLPPVRVVTVVGGQDIGRQGQAVREGCDIVVGTPGRIIDCLDNRYMVLNQCFYVVLDEADRMVDMGFELQLQAVMGQITTALKDADEARAEAQARAAAVRTRSALGSALEQNPATRSAEPTADGPGQAGSCALDRGRMVRVTSMYSATMPRELERLAQTYMRAPLTISIGDDKSRLNRRIEQRVVMCSAGARAKSRELRQALEDAPRGAGCMIFCNKRKTADAVVRDIRGQGHRCAVLHGGRSQDQREASLADLRAGRLRFLVATDVAGRGIDVKNVAMVINYDMPDDVQKYVHRIGRTGRAGRTGTAVTLLTEEDYGVFWGLKRHLEATGQRVPRDLAKHPMSKVRPGEALQGFNAKRYGKVR